MNKTKDEMIATAKEGEHVINYLEPITPNDVRRAYFIGIETGVSVAYDHRQKEIDDISNNFQVLNDHCVKLESKWLCGVAEANRWWASRWAKYRGLVEAVESLECKQQRLMDLDAAARKILENGK